MFRKWIQKSRPPPSDRPLFEAPRERRRTYRVKPDPEVPVRVEIAGWSVCVEDISVGGVALPLPTLPIFEQVPALLTLPDGLPPCTVMLRGTEKDRKGIHHCVFLDLSDELEARLFDYVLHRDQQLLSDIPPADG